MKKLSLILIIFSHDLFAKNSDFLAKDNFYIGIDATKNNKTIGKIDNSIPQEKVEEDRYYGYKFGDRGFFVSPEFSIAKANNQSVQNSSTKSQDGLNISNPWVNYNLKANLGYDFNKHFSGFITYDIAKFSLNSEQNLGVNANPSFTNGGFPVLGVGSQVNFSNDFGVKFSYSQQQFQNTQNGSGKINADVIKIGTVYSF